MTPEEQRELAAELDAAQAHSEQGGRPGLFYHGERAGAGARGAGRQAALSRRRCSCCHALLARIMRVLQCSVRQYQGESGR
jgi:hypothetical protein